MESRLRSAFAKGARASCFATLPDWVFYGAMAAGIGSLTLLCCALLVTALEVTH
jgi:hypothetical protein